MIDKQMDAIRLHALGDPTSLAYERIETPQPGAGEVLVGVCAAAITRDELDWPENRLPATPSYEFSGLVAALGPGTTGTAVGEAVYALGGFDRDGAAAQYVAVPEAVLARKPRTLSHLEAAAIPLAGLSAWQGLFEYGRLSQGQRVLIHGVGGVGALAIQLAKAGGAEVTATTSPEKIQPARELGADQVVDHTTTRFEEVIDPVDLVFDTAAGHRLTRSPAVVRDGGRIVSVAAEPPRDTTARGTEAVYFVVEPNGAQLAQLATLAENGRLRPTIDQVFPLKDARKAFERTSSQNRHGKIVLQIADLP
jgi:NADPH:quinone reductase-like Zn-dependent oxidoreductase